MNAIGGTNLFSYCLNNPVNDTDQSGEIPTFLIGALVGGLVQGGINLFGQLAKNDWNIEEIDWIEVGIETASGALFGALAASGASGLWTIGAKMGISGLRAMALSINDDDPWQKTIFKTAGSIALTGGLAVVSNYASNRIYGSLQGLRIPQSNTLSPIGIAIISGGKAAWRAVSEILW